jgi:hypothetical protein
MRAAFFLVEVHVLFISAIAQEQNIPKLESLKDEEKGVFPYT